MGKWEASLLLTVDPNHVFQDEDPLCQDLQGFSKLLHTLTLVRMKSQVQGLSQAGVGQEQRLCRHSGQSSQPCLFCNVRTTTNRHRSQAPAASQAGAPNRDHQRPTQNPVSRHPHSDIAQGFNFRPNGLKPRFFSCRGFLRAPSQRALL